MQVDVVRRGDYYNGYVWTIAFLTPFGYVEPIRVDTSDVEVSDMLLFLSIAILFVSTQKSNKMLNFLCSCFCSHFNPCGL